MIYLVLTPPSVENAKAISKLFYSLSAPSSSATTQFYCSWVVHPLTHEVALAFSDMADLPVSAQINPTTIVDGIRSLITTAEATALETAIHGCKNIAAASGGVSMIEPINYVPASLTVSVKTYDEMLAGGWFAVDTF